MPGGMINRSFRADVHNCPASLPQHGGNDYVGERVACVEIQSKHEIVGLSIHLPQFDSAGVTSSRVHHHIQTVVTCDDRIHQGAHSSFIRGIQCFLLQARGSRSRSFAQRFKALRGVACCHHLCAFFQERHRDCSTQTTSCPGNERYLTCELLCHGSYFSPFSFFSILLPFSF